MSEKDAEQLLARLEGLSNTDLLMCLEHLTDPNGDARGLLEAHPTLAAMLPQLDATRAKLSEVLAEEREREGVSVSLGLGAVQELLETILDGRGEIGDEAFMQVIARLMPSFVLLMRAGLQIRGDSETLQTFRAQVQSIAGEDLDAMALDESEILKGLTHPDARLLYTILAGLVGVHPIIGFTAAKWCGALRQDLFDFPAQRSQGGPVVYEPLPEEMQALLGRIVFEGTDLRTLYTRWHSPVDGAVN